MIKEVIKEWPGEVEIDGQLMSSEEAASKIDFNTLQSIESISLLTRRSKAIESNSDVNKRISESDDKVVYEITVKPYMTKPATPDFDFMAKWNNDIPMPMATMIGYAEKETPGMVYMHLKGLAKKTITCLCCGRELTNPISRQYGIGPICLGKIGITRDIEDVSGIIEELESKTWEGWVIKSAIITKKECNNED